MKIEARAPGKLILLGEYAVLEGAPALVAAVNRFARATYRPGTHPEIYLTAPTVSKETIRLTPGKDGTWYLPERTPEPLRQKLLFTLTALNFVSNRILPPDRSLPGGDLYLESEDFYLTENGSRQKLGLGSSAAITVALLAVLLQAANHPLPEPSRMFSLAQDIHRQAQGKVGSGVDVAASLLGGILRFRQPSPNRPETLPAIPLKWPPHLRMIAVWSGASASTTDLVGKVHRWREKNPERFREFFEDLTRLSEAGCRAFEEGNTARFLEVVETYGQALERLGVASGANIVSENHRRLGAIVRSAGGVYKPSGAGGGDLGLAFTASEQTARKVSAKLLENGFSVINLAIAKHGIVVLTV